MNNKGQTLVIFVIILPILLLITIIGIDISKAYYEKNQTKNQLKEIIRYGLSNYSEEIDEKINNLIDINIKNIESKSIFISDQQIEIKLTKQITIFGKKYTSEYHYSGTNENNQIKIKEE